MTNQTELEQYRTLGEHVAEIAIKDKPTYKDAIMVAIAAVNDHIKKIKALESIVESQHIRIATLEALADAAQNASVQKAIPRENFGS